MHAYSPFFSPSVPGFMALFLPFLLIATVWTIVLKGFALWHAARGGQKKWFVALLVINTLGILEIIYLIWFRPDAHKHDQEKMPMSPSSSAQ